MKVRRVLLVTPAWPSSLGYFCARAFRSLGIEPQVFDYRQHAYGHSRYQQEQAGRLQVLRNRLGIWAMNRRLRQNVAQFAPDLILAIKGELVEARTIRALADAGSAAVALWFPDTSRSLDQRRYRRVAAAMQWYHATFLCDPLHVPDTVRPQIRRLEYLTFACDPEYHHRVALTAEQHARYGGAIAFVGNWQGEDSPRYALLRELAGYPVTVWGMGWHNSDLATYGIRLTNQPAYAEDLLRVYSSSPLALNFNLDAYLNLRNFEMPACGPLAVTSHVPQLAEYFEPDIEIVTFADADELRAKLDYYLAHPDAAARMAQLGMERAHREHTFPQRMGELLAKLGRA
jgi:spore maturation protein CgeB